MWLGDVEHVSEGVFRAFSQSLEVFHSQILDPITGRLGVEVFGLSSKVIVAGKRYASPIQATNLAFDPSLHLAPRVANRRILR